ncbi:hypothetical protein B0H16DRAFT_1739075 [Mycena metata]|uniref:F-box domain-containing protein n=1 Tax=Mycena metata TaxID=1033252 RepID=A0AAD7HGJ4_9AGAR|nr:hypothetical protein B0H16DRAFT_1739075 [Mycena metata]
MAPICVLPNELMARILTIYAAETDTLFNLKWSKVMYVGRHWHELARAAQSLWSFIDLVWHGSYETLYNQLRHSGVAPLTIKLALGEYAQYTDIILDECERISSLLVTTRISYLDVSGTSQYVYELIGKLPECRLPILRSLSLDPSYKRDELPPNIVEAIPPVLFEGILPSLRELKLKSVAFPLGSLSGLTSISLTECLDISAGLPSIASFRGLLEMLGSCPELSTLKLELTTPEPIPQQSYPTVDLAALTWLQLREDVTLCTALLKHVRFPPTTSVHVLPSGVFNGMDIRELLVPLHKHARSPGAPALPLLQIDCHPYGTDSRNISYCTMALFTDTQLHDFLERSQAHCPFSLNSHPSTEVALRQIVAKVLKAIPGHLITHLDARNMSYPGEVSWKTILKLLPALETGYLRVNESAVPCVHALTQIEGLQQQRENFPRIQRLQVLIMPHTKSESENNMVDEFLAALGQYFTVCKGNETPFEVLDIEDPRYALSQTERQAQLERLFPLMGDRLLWNGQVYDPVKRREKLAKRKAEWKALAEKYGLDTE